MLLAVIFIICFVIIVIVGLTYIIVNCKTHSVSIELKQSNPFERSEKWKLIAHYITLLTLFIYIVFSLNAIINELSYSLQLSCSVLGKLSLSLYHTSNYLLFCVIICYWKHLYYGSEFYDKKIKYTQYAIWLLMILQWFYALYFDIRFVESTQSTETLRHCEDMDIRLFPWLFGFLQVLFDIILCALFVVMFFIPFQSILHYGPNSAATFDKQTVMLIPKFFFLVSIMIFTHLIILFISIGINMLWLIHFDILINAVCIVLMSISFQKYYETVCVCFDKSIRKRLYSKAQFPFENTGGNIEMDVEDQIGLSDSTRQLL